MSNTPSQNPEIGWGEQLGRDAVDQMYFQDWLEDLAVDDPEALAAIIRSKTKNAADYYRENGQVDFEKLRKDLTLNDRVSLLVNHWFGDFASDLIDEHMPDLSSSIEVKNFEDAVASLDFDEGPVYMPDDNNLLVSSGSPLDQIGALWQMVKDSSFDIVEHKAELSLLIKNSRAIVGAADILGGGGTSPAKVKMLGKVCEKLGLKLNRVNPNSALAKPEENEIQLVMAPVGLPLKTGSGSEVDMDVMEWYKEMYEDDAGCVWYSTSPILAGVLMMQGVSLDDAISEMDLSPNRDLATQLVNLEQQLNPSSSDESEEGVSEKSEEKADS